MQKLQEEVAPIETSTYLNSSRDSKFLDSFKTIKPSDFEINFSGFSENKTPTSIPKEKIQKTFFFPSKFQESSTKSEIELSNEKKLENLEKKRDSFNYMKKWDDYHKQINSIYRSIVEKIMNFLLELGNSSLESYICLIRFLKDKAIQEKNFSNISNNNELINLEKYNECEISTCFQELALIENSQKKDHAEFSAYVETEQQKLVKGQTKYQSFFDHFKKMENKMRQNLNKMFLIRKEKFEEYATIFAEIMRFYLTSNKLLNKDLLTLENVYLYSVVENHNILKFYSNQMIEFWNCLKKIELERIKEFALVINNFLERKDKIYQLFPWYEEDCSGIRNKLQIFDPEKHIDSLFDLNKILASEQIQYLKQKFKIENCSEENIFKYLQSFEMKSVAFRPLIIAQIHAYEKDETGTQKYSLKESSLWKEIKLIISVDMNMLVLGDTNELCFKPKKIIRLPLCTCLYNEEIYMATISEIKSTVLSMNNVEKHYFKFKGSQELNEFKEFLSKYIRII